MLPAASAGCAKPLLVRLCDELRDCLARDDVKAWALSCGTEGNKYVVMVWSEEVLTLLLEHPNLCPALISLALDCNRSSRGLVGGEYVDAPGIA